MGNKYELNTRQLSVLRALAEGIVEMPKSEIAVRARMLPKDVETALQSLEQSRLVQSWPSSAGSMEDRIYAPTEDGLAIHRGFAPYRGSPQVGTIVEVRGTSGFFSSRRSDAWVEVTD